MTNTPDIALAVIGGSGLYAMPGLTDIEERAISTPFGNPSDAVVIGTLHGKRIAFLPRHGRGHRFNPSEVPYRANIYALKTLGVRHVVSVSACGSLRLEMKPRDIVVPSQLFDFTRGKRAPSFFDDGMVGHIGVAEPFSNTLRSAVAQAVQEAAGHVHSPARVHAQGTLITIEGPRFSTKAESLAFRGWGCDIIGMTACPEAFLAREAELDFAIMAHVTDYDVWHAEEEPVTVEIVVERLHANLALAQQAISNLLPRIESLPHETHDAAKHAVMTNKNIISGAAQERLKLIMGR